MKKMFAYSILFMALALLALDCGGKKKQVLDDQIATKPDTTQAVKPPPKDTVDESALRDEQFRRDQESLEKIIYFEFDAFSLSEKARDILAGNGKFMQQYYEGALKIEGHCDERGSTEYNLALGQKRADEAKNYLVTYGVGAERIATVSWGEEKPADAGHDETSWLKNRRDELSYSKQ